MAIRRVFYSFHYQPDNWRAAKVRNIGMIEGNQPARDNDWETVKRGGHPQKPGTSGLIKAIAGNSDAPRLL